MPKEPSKLLYKDESRPTIGYTDEQREYLSALQKRMTTARDARDQARVEFDGMTYVKYCEENRKLANSYIQPKQNREDTNYQSGTIRQKMFSVLASINNLDLSADINVFDRDDIEMADFAQALEDIIWKTEELDNDEEKKLLRQYTLLEQGTAFVNEDWIEKIGIDKTITKEFDGKTAKWNKRMKKLFEGASREIIQNEKVYLGDITQFEMGNQPFVYTVEVLPYSVAEQIYGEWDMWKYVDKRRRHFLSSDDAENTLYNSNWLVTEIQDNQVEIVKYQSLPDNEFQIVINSIPMLPIGFPMPWKHGQYSLVKQVYSVISPHFAYGKSFPSVSRLQVAVWDEMLRLMVLKTQKSFKPPMANLTGRVLSSRILMPGVISHGVDPEQFKPMDPEGSRGLTNGEVGALNLIKDQIDQLTVNPTFTGNAPSGSPTATEILEVQRQARVVLGLTVFVCAMLEKKLADLRLMNVLEHWFDPFDDSFDEKRGELKERFRSFSRKAPIAGYGMGQRMSRVTQEMKGPMDLLMEEEDVTEKTGTETRIIELNPDVIRNTKYQFVVTVVPKEKRSSPTNKLMFREMLADVALFDRPQNGVSVDWAYLADRFAINWEENSEKLFKKSSAEEMGQMQMAQQQMQGGQGAGTTMATQQPGQRARVNMNVGMPS